MADDRVTDAMVEAALKAWQETNVTFGDLHSLMRAAIESALRAEAGAVGGPYIRVVAKRNLRSLIQRSNDSEKELMLKCLEELS